MEVGVNVWLEMQNENVAKTLSEKLKKAALECCQELTRTINSLQRIKNFEKFSEIDIDEISNNKNIISIIGYTGRTDPVTWFADALYQLGVPKLAIKEQWDEGAVTHYYTNGKKVSKKIFLNPDAVKEPRELIQAKLVEYKTIGKKGDTMLLEFFSDKHEQFFYKGKGALTKLASDSYENIAEFRGTFVKGTLNGKQVTFVKRPSGVAMELSHDKFSFMYHTSPDQLDTKAKCPFCGGSLRSEKAKQCPSCFKSWKGGA